MSDDWKPANIKIPTARQYAPPAQGQAVRERRFSAAAQPFVPIPPPELPQVASAVLLRDWRAADFMGFPDNTSLGDVWTSHDDQAHVLIRGSGASGLTVSKAGTSNNREYIIFNGLDDWMLNEECSDLDNLDAFAVFVASDFSGCLISKMNNTSSGDGWALYNAGTNGLIQDAGGSHWIQKAIPSAIIVTGIATLEVLGKSPSDMNVYTNGDNTGQEDLSNPPVASFATIEPLRVSVFGDFNTFYGGWMFGILIYKITDLISCPTDRAAIIQWMIDNELGLES